MTGLGPGLRTVRVKVNVPPGSGRLVGLAVLVVVMVGGAAVMVTTASSVSVTVFPGGSVAVTVTTSVWVEPAAPATLPTKRHV